MSKLTKPIVKSTTTRTIAISSFLVSLVPLMTFLDDKVQAAVIALITGTVIPIVSRLLVSRGWPGLSSLPILLVPTLALTLVACASNRAVFEEFDPETGKVLYRGTVQAKAGYGGSIEEAKAAVDWSNSNLVHNEDGLPDTSDYRLTNTQDTGGLASPDTASSVGLSINQAIGTVTGYKLGMAEIEAQPKSWERVVTNPDVLKFLENVAAGRIVFDVPAEPTPELP